MFLHALILFTITLAGIYLSCKVFAYEITDLRKFVAAGAFVVLNSTPIQIPLISLLIPPAALYIALMDNSYSRWEVNRVFGLTLVIAIAGVLIVYLPQLQ